MAPDDHDRFSSIGAPDQPDAERQLEVVTPGRSRVGIVVSVVAVIGLGLAWFTGSPGEGAPPATPDPPVSTPPSPDRSPAPDVGLVTVTEPRIEGQLPDGAAFEVRERMPGVLCAVVPARAATSDDRIDDGIETGPVERCHHELVTGSGAAVLDTGLIFGYLRPGTASASLRYRAGGSADEGLQVEPSAGFFALPILSDDPYRLQYRSATDAVVDEVPLVPLGGGPSQTDADAARDDVPSEIARLPFNRRVVGLAEWPSPSTGPYVWSRIDPSPTADPWSEVVLLDETGTRILRSTPVPDLRIRDSVSTDDALFLIGDQILGPESLAVDREEPRFPVAVVRIDHGTGASLVRLFPQPSTESEPTIEPVLRHANWLPGPDDLAVSADSITISAEGLQLRATTDPGDDRGVIEPAFLDPVTLLPR